MLLRGLVARDTNRDWCMLKELSAVFFNSARKPGVCARNGFTAASPEGHHSTERCPGTAGGIRIKGHFSSAALEVLL